MKEARPQAMRSGMRRRDAGGASLPWWLAAQPLRKIALASLALGARSVAVRAAVGQPPGPAGPRRKAMWKKSAGLRGPSAKPYPASSSSSDLNP